MLGIFDDRQRPTGGSTRVHRGAGWRRQELRRGPCSYCGALPEPGSLHTIDHIVPRSLKLGLTDNLAPACAVCNQSKGAMSLLRFLLARDARRGAR